MAQHLLSLFPTIQPLDPLTTRKVYTSVTTATQYRGTIGGTKKVISLNNSVQTDTYINS